MIKDFPLVNPVAHYAQFRGMVAPIHPLLSSKAKFYWNNELQTAFKELKDVIIEAIHEGIEIFKPNRRTAIQTDYLKKRIVYFLRQQYCECPKGVPG